MADLLRLDNREVPALNGRTWQALTILNPPPTQRLQGFAAQAAGWPPDLQSVLCSNRPLAARLSLSILRGHFQRTALSSNLMLSSDLSWKPARVCTKRAPRATYRSCACCTLTKVILRTQRIQLYGFRDREKGKIDESHVQFRVAPGVSIYFGPAQRQACWANGSIIRGVDVGLQ